MTINSMFNPAASPISVQCAIATVQLLNCCLWLHCFFNCIAELHLMVMILQDLLYFQSVLMSAESFERFAQTAHSLVVGYVYAVAQISQCLLLMTTQGTSLMVQLNMQSFSHRLSMHVLSCHKCLLSTSQSIFFHSFQLFNGFGSSCLIQIHSLFQFIAISVIFIRSLLFPAIWSQFPQQSSILSISQLTRCSNLMHIMMYLFQYFNILCLCFTLQTIGQVFLPNILHQLKIQPHFILISLEIYLPPLFLFLACLQQLLFQFESNFGLILHYLRQQPFNGHTIMVKRCNVSSICL